MCRSFLTYTGVTVTWIYVYLCVVRGHDDFRHDDRGYMYEPHLRDYHYDQSRYHYDQDRYDYEKHESPPASPSSRLDRPPPSPRRGRPSPFKDWPPPRPSPPRTERPAPLFDRGDKLPILYMEDHCRLHIRTFFFDDARVYVDGSMHVKLTKNPSRQSSSSCIVTFSTRDPDYRLLLHFERVDINYNPGTVDRFRIYDGKDTGKELTPARGLYGKYSKGNYEFSSGNIQDYKSSGQELTLYFVGSPSEDFRGFELLLTVFKDPSPDNQCDPGYLKCKVNGYCISESLYCNGAQNCGNDDFSDSRDCSHHDSGHDHDDPNAMFQGPTDIGLMVGCALSIVILMVVIIWLGVICLKKKGFDRMRRHYARQEDLSDGAAAPDGTIVEPAQIHRVMSPPVTFMEPPPLYSENDNHHGSSEEGSYPSGRFELPPPYSPVDDRDTAGLILNQSDNRNQPTVPPYNQPQADVHQGTNQTRAPTPPIRTSSIPSHNNNSEGRLRLRHSSGAQSAFRPLTGITGELSKDEQAACPPTPKILHSDDSGIPSSSSLDGPVTDGTAATQTAGTQTSNVDESSDNTLACHIDNECNESIDKNVSVA